MYRLRATCVFFILFLSSLWAQQQDVQASGAIYYNETYGFTIQTPSFPKVDFGGIVVPVLFAGAPKDGFAANVNIVVHQIPVALEEYRNNSLAQFQQEGLKLNREAERLVQDRRALVLDYEGSLKGSMDLRWLSMAVFDQDAVYVITCSGTQKEFERYLSAFEASLSSFRIAEEVVAQRATSTKAPHE